MYLSINLDKSFLGHLLNCYVNTLLFSTAYRVISIELLWPIEQQKKKSYFAKAIINMWFCVTVIRHPKHTRFVNYYKIDQGEYLIYFQR